MSAHEHPPHAPAFPDEELAGLVHGLLDGTLTPEDRTRLAARLKTEPAARRAYVKAVELDAMLQKEFPAAASDSLPDDNTLEKTPASDATRWPVWAASLAAILVLGLFVYLPAPRAVPGSARSSTTTSRETTPLARVTRLPADAGTHNGKPLVLGQEIGIGPLVARNGPLQLTFNCGAVVTLGAESELHLQSDMQACLTRGRLRAHVPPQAQGFLLTTPNSSVLDLGTEFGLDVQTANRTEVHVIEGMIEAQSLATKVQGTSVQVRQSEAIAINRKGISSVPYDPDRFVKLFSEIPLNPVEGLIHWSFDNTIKNRINDASGRHPLWIRQMDARENSPHIPLVPGVVGKALDLSSSEPSFAGSNSHGIAGSNARSVAFWVRVPADKTPTNVLNGLIAWGMWNTSKKWQVMLNINPDAGQLGAIRVDVADGQGYIGSTDLRDGQWHHVAVVCPGGPGAKIGTHTRIYIDGRLEKPTGASKTDIDTAAHAHNARTITLGRFVGYVNPQSKMGFFKGQIDEVYLYDDVFTPAQIQNLMHRNSLD